MPSTVTAARGQGSITCDLRLLFTAEDQLLYVVTCELQRRVNDTIFYTDLHLVVICRACANLFLDLARFYINQFETLKTACLIIPKHNLRILNKTSHMYKGFYL